MNNKIDKYRTERLSINNLTDVEKLHTAVYGKVPPLNFIYNKYDTTFTNIKYTGFIAYHDQLPIAFYAVIPCFIRFEDKIVLAAQSADTMTHPQYRNRGLFVELALLTFQVCRSTGIQFIFGFPNQNSLPGFIDKLGWKRTENMDCFIIKTAKFPWKRLFRRSFILKSLYNSYQQKLLKKYIIPQQGIANSVFEDGLAGVYRDYQYLKYKTYTARYVIKIGNSMLWIKINDVLLIGDITVNADDFDVMINELRKLAGRLGIKEIHFHASPNTTLHNLFVTRFDPRPSFPVIFKDLAGDTQVNKIKFTTADIDTF